MRGSAARRTTRWRHAPTSPAPIRRPTRSAPLTTAYWIRVTVTATNASGATSQYSLPTYQVKRNRPDNTTRPVLTGTPQVGATLTTTTGAWDNAPDGYTYAWKRCTSILLASCTTIDGATLSSYAPTAQDTGMHIRAYVTATNSGGSATAYTYPSAKVTIGA